MATLSSSSTDTEVKAAYDDNAGYAEDNSVAMAKVFVTACRILLRRLPKKGKLGARHEIELDLRAIQEELRDAKRWLLANDAKGVRAFSVADFRD